MDVMEFSLICSLSLFTDDREMRRIGLSLDNRIGLDLPAAFLVRKLLPES